jgi:GNAT superfamily N-acetyltransferase
MKSEQDRPDCAIRAPQPGDFERMAELAGQLGYPCTPQEIERRLAGMQDGTQHAVYVAELEEGEIAGWIGTYVFRSVELDSSVEISGLVVDKGVRYRGIGKLLLEAAERWTVSCCCDTIAVHCNVKRHDAHRFYQKNGYEWTKTQKLFRKTLTIGDADTSRRPKFEGTR